MIPWREQFRLLGRCLRFAYWTKGYPWWANVATLITLGAFIVCLYFSLFWPGVAGFFLLAFITLLGKPEF